MMDKDLDKLDQIIKVAPQIQAICLDVANGYSEHFVKFVQTVRHKYPEHIIMVSSFTFIATEF